MERESKSRVLVRVLPPVFELEDKRLELIRNIEPFVAKYGLLVFAHEQEVMHKLFPKENASEEGKELNRVRLALLFALSKALDRVYRG